MKTKLLLSAILSFIFCILSSQVPQGFNYQAIARDGSTPIVTPITVRITIQSEQAGGTAFWIEDHTSVTPNESGLFSLVIGNGVRQTGSTVDSFNHIDWSVTPKYIKTEINYGGWKTMGASALWTVPYSMVAKNLDGPVEKLGVTGNTDNMEEALFEVKNKQGQTVFAVYNEGVRVYVDDGDKKGSKGGFAIGGFGGSKTPAQNYFVVKPDTIRMYIDNTPGKGSKGGFAIGGFGGTKTLAQKYLVIKPDTIRMYIDDTPAKGAKGGFAIGGFSGSKGDNKNFLSVATDASDTIDPGENRILWYPLKNAFLTGKVRIGTPDSVGENSFATGYQAKASGMYSQSMGFKTIAGGDYSTAIGKNALAETNNSFAFGDGAHTTDIDSYAFGAGAIASGQGSFAFGSFGRDTATFVPNTEATNASGDYAFAIGLGAKSSGNSSTALGIMANASGNASMSIGVASSAQGEKSLALNAGLATGRNSLAFGPMSKAAGDYSIAMGRGITKFGGVYNLANGYESIALGYSRVYGMYTIGIGTANVGTSTLDCSNGIGIGNSVNVTGDYSMAIGTQVTASAFKSVVVGTSNVISGSKSSWVATEPIFVVGNGLQPSTPSNALTILKNGNTGIGTTTPSYTLDVAGIARTSVDTYLSTASGNVGIGTTSPSQKLHVAGNQYISGDLIIGTTFDVAPLNVEKWMGTVAMFNRRNSDGTIISFYHGDAFTQVGTISVIGDVITYNAFTGSHYGITDEKIDEGKLVVMNGGNSRYNDQNGSEILYGISESTKANDPAAMGAYLGILESMKPFSNTNPYLIMAEGNGEMWVVDKGENLSPGDMLISSDIKGHAMKDKGEFTESYVIAKVAEPVDWEKVTETLNGVKHFKVSVLFTSFVRNNILINNSQKVTDLNLQLQKQNEEINILKAELAQIKALLNK